jgi:mono/diheme cytochrome c family protein
VARVAGLLSLAGTLWGCRAQGEKPGFVVLPGMYQSVPYDAYDPNPVTRTGQTLLPPPDGTVPRAGGAFPYGSGPPEAERAGRDLVSPIEPSPANLARGKQVFENVCAVCHGVGGQGDGPIIGRFPNPPILTAPHARSLPDGRIFHIIARGQGIMPAHAAQVVPDDRWRVVLYLRQLQAGSAVAPPAIPAGPPSASAAGASR